MEGQLELCGLWSVVKEEVDLRISEYQKKSEAARVAILLAMDDLEKRKTGEQPIAFSLGRKIAENSEESAELL